MSETLLTAILILVSALIAALLIVVAVDAIKLSMRSMGDKMMDEAVKARNDLIVEDYNNPDSWTREQIIVMMRERQNNAIRYENMTKGR